MHTSTSLKQRPAPLESFERNLAARLQALETAADAAYLALPWLQQAMSVVLETHEEVAAMVPHLRGQQEVDERWMEDYLDDSAKLLDCCKVMQEGVGELAMYQRMVEVALHALTGNNNNGGPGGEQQQQQLTEAQAGRARATLQECKEAAGTAMGTRSSSGSGGGGSTHHGTSCRSRLDSYGSMLRSIGDRLAAAPRPHEASTPGQGFMAAVYGAKVVTVYVCSLVLAAVAFRPSGRKPHFHHMGVNHHPLWAAPLQGLIHKVKDETERRRASATVPGGPLLQELDNVETAVAKAHHFLNTLLLASSGDAFPLSREQSSDLAKLVEILGASSTELSTGAVALEDQINQLFHSLVRNRITVLDCLTTYPV